MTQIQIEYDTHLEDVIPKVNEALEKYGLEFVEDDQEHDGFIIYDLVNHTAQESTDAREGSQESTR
jgi:hypothetical protein